MAFTERYVTVAGAGAHNGTSEADAWTFAEMITALGGVGTGIRVNMKSGTYSEGSTTLPAGAANAPFVLRGYDATIGDLDNLGRNADGTLNTTGMPDITITALWFPSIWMVLQNLDITGALSSALIGSANTDLWSMISCRVINTQNNASARTIQGDNDCSLINCDLECTGAAHASVVDVDLNAYLFMCRLVGTSSSSLVTCDSAEIMSNVFVGNSSNVGITLQGASTLFRIVQNTFYNLTTAVSLPNALNALAYVFINNICTDSGAWINSLYSGTATVAIFECNNRTRDVTTLLTGTESVQLGAVTTDTGGPDTDYVNAAAGNLRLIPTSPAVGVGMTPYIDIGAFQIQAGGGSSTTTVQVQTQRNLPDIKTW